ncbi:MAG: radical SAM protein [Tenericutes bacterium]|nr:radical SAM protein [Mycoplasmatota bacterium]
MANYSIIKDRLLKSAYKSKTPIVGEFELTSHCNFDCAMCYAKSNDEYLSKSQWINIFDQAYANGMLFALLTGGEIFTRPDFIELYEYLYDLGVKITLYTNGSILPTAILNTLVKRPPELIAITLYGFDSASYKSFTKNDAFSNVSKNIDSYKKNNLNLILRTIPLPDIYINLEKIINFAKDKKVFLSYFLYVSKSSEDMKRLNTTELIDFKQRIDKAFPLKENESTSQHCGAFRNAFFINHKGYMQGCAMMPIPTEKVEDNFIEVFNILGAEWRKHLKKSPCKDCSINKSCFTCLARRYLEGDMYGCSEYLKEFARSVSK